ncbi:hypothetical protein [Methylocaldum szegediense]|uniref:hypothetical protein n=1 Tax=Methylocaldum szegediense TaxID=73780 RepID=UPI0012EBD801|nr:hypothetical protein [Methylocaldum szegediense]
MQSSFLAPLVEKLSTALSERCTVRTMSLEQIAELSESANSERSRSFGSYVVSLIWRPADINLVIATHLDERLVITLFI